MRVTDTMTPQEAMSTRKYAHPALSRFSRRDNGSSRLLLIKAAAGTGRTWFAASWIGERVGEVLDWSTGAQEERADIATVVARLRADARLHIAIILCPEASTLAMSAYLPALVAGQRDLLLDTEETLYFLQEEFALTLDDARRIHEQCGGWIQALKVFLADGEEPSGARQVIRSAFAVWFEPQQHLLELCDAAYLAKFDEPTVETFFGEFSSHPHTLAELSDAGFLHVDEFGALRMAELVRENLLAFAARLGPERTAILEKAAAHATVLHEGILEAMESAVRLRRWASLQNLLENHWTDVFVKDPLRLRAIAAAMPRFHSDQVEYMGLAIRFLNMADKDGMELQLPVLAADYASDRLAQRLHSDTERLYRKPNARAVTLGMLEMFHLRINGHYTEAGAAALRLRQMNMREDGSEPINSSLLAFSIRQAGISLQLAGNDIAARQAYEAAYQEAKKSDIDILKADIAGRLSLLNALVGNTEAAHYWLADHQHTMESVSWGRKTIAHAALLAEAYLRLIQLDFTAAQELLATMPLALDNNEFWAANAYLVAMVRIQTGVPESARSVLETLRAERRFSAASPMSARLIDEALFFATAFDPRLSADETHYANGVLQAFHLLLRGKPDAALGELHKQLATQGPGRWSNLASYCDVAARNPGTPGIETMQRVNQLFKNSRNIAEVSLLMRIPGWSNIAPLLELTAEERTRLSTVSASFQALTFARPALTPREREILSQLRAGLSRRQIADAGYRSENTVKAQLRGLYRKLAATTLEQALDRARELGL